MSAGTLYYTAFESPHCRRDGLLWRWSITDGYTGPTLISGTALTEWRANVKLGRALQRCKRRQHVVDISHPPLHPLSVVEQAAVIKDLRAEGVRVYVKRDGETVVLCPLTELSTWERVHAMAVVKRRTDAPVRWAGAAR